MKGQNVLKEIFHVWSYFPWFFCIKGEGNNFFSKWGNKIRFPVGNSEGNFLKLNIVQKQITWFVQNNKDKNSFLLRDRFVLSQWEQVKELIYDSSYCTKPRDDFVQVNKTLSATRKNIPYRSLLSEGSFKKNWISGLLLTSPVPLYMEGKTKSRLKGGDAHRNKPTTE